jgi:hypothetical protein
MKNKAAAASYGLGFYNRRALQSAKIPIFSEGIFRLFSINSQFFLVNPDNYYGDVKVSSISRDSVATVDSGV